MHRVGPYTFAFAVTEADFEAVHALNYQTFVREIPQHAGDGTGRLVDKFHDRNRYLIARKDGTHVGMLALHDAPPWSVTDRLPDPKFLDDPAIRPLEIRLLAVVPDERTSPVMLGLVWALYDYARAHGFTHFVISAVVEQRTLYEHLGFVALGPPVGAGRACFLPMWLPLPRLEAKMARLMELWQRRLERSSAETAP